MTAGIDGEAGGRRHEKFECPICKCWSCMPPNSEMCYECQQFDLDGEPLRQPAETEDQNGRAPW